MKKKNKIQELNELKDAVVRRYFPNAPHMYITERAYGFGMEKVYQQDAAIDAKVLWVIQVGLTAKDLNDESAKIEKRNKELADKRAAQDHKEHEERQEFLKNHTHDFELVNEGFLSWKRRCKNEKCPRHWRPYL